MEESSFCCLESGNQSGLQISVLYFFDNTNLRPIDTRVSFAYKVSSDTMKTGKKLIKKAKKRGPVKI